MIGHDIAHGRSRRILPARHGTDGDITIRQHSDESVIFADWQKADIVLRHQFRRLVDRHVRIDHVDVARHSFLDLHE